MSIYKGVEIVSTIIDNEIRWVIYYGSLPQIFDSQEAAKAYLDELYKKLNAKDSSQ